ncbi:MAG: bifunctional phosphoribosylaminoimidazolecarboxamide formyltransferase/IMP cyclohydrolase [Rickettsiales bacterium]|jgi:phosphoribosylaminoimidazolecarboxamide formyltransferase/IMP cyclohydrolase|nr:bifunctional phosphoribosylaminoimidazolecarboxamide formyltransferase/IMP cyclohydrolase [Rickettsiales bacterium]
MKRAGTALISVYDKTGVVEFARELYRLGYDILSSGGTYAVLKEAQIPCKEVSEYTGVPESPDGLVKTINPKIEFGIMANPNDPEHVKYLNKIKARKIDLVCCNFYPAEDALSKVSALADGNEKADPSIIKNWDIGGPLMARAAAKKHEYCLPVVDPADYDETLEAIRNEQLGKGEIPYSFRRALAAKVVAETSYYDGLIADYMEPEKFPAKKTIPLKKVDTEIRYAENPHQKGALYHNAIDGGKGLAINAKQLHGKALSYNNYLDLDAAKKFIEEFASDRPMCNIAKHNNTCGAAIGDTLLEAYQKAFVCDPLSAFGGIMSFNKMVDVETAKEIVYVNKHFVECIIAPGYSAGALQVLKTKKDLRLVEQPAAYEIPSNIIFKAIDGGMLAQERDTKLYDQLEIVSKRRPTPDEMEAMLFAWRACKPTKSNGIIVGRGQQLVGVGTGQQSRIDSLEIAIKRMMKMQGSRGGVARKLIKLATKIHLMAPEAPLVMASDAFFPFPDCVEVFAEYGGSAVIWTGGSMNDPKVVKAADKRGIAMVKTHTRHFAH